MHFNPSECTCQFENPKTSQIFTNYEFSPLDGDIFGLNLIFPGWSTTRVFQKVVDRQNWQTQSGTYDFFLVRQKWPNKGNQLREEKINFLAPHFGFFKFFLDCQINKLFNKWSSFKIRQGNWTQEFFKCHNLIPSEGQSSWLLFYGISDSPGSFLHQIRWDCFCKAWRDTWLFGLHLARILHPDRNKSPQNHFILISDELFVQNSRNSFLPTPPVKKSPQGCSKWSCRNDSEKLCGKPPASACVELKKEEGKGTSTIATENRHFRSHFRPAHAALPRIVHRETKKKNKKKFFWSFLPPTPFTLLPSTLYTVKIPSPPYLSFSSSVSIFTDNKLWLLPCVCYITCKKIRFVFFEYIWR